MVCQLFYVKTHRTGHVQMCFYFCLLIITTIAIIKANVMIVTDTRPVNSSFIINNKASTSIIRITSSFVGGKPHLFILFSYGKDYNIKFKVCLANKTIFLRNFIAIIIKKIYNNGIERKKR